MVHCRQQLEDRLWPNHFVLESRELVRYTEQGAAWYTPWLHAATSVALAEVEPVPTFKGLALQRRGGQTSFSVLHKLPKNSDQKTTTTSFCTSEGQAYLYFDHKSQFLQNPPGLRFLHLSAPKIPPQRSYIKSSGLILFFASSFSTFLSLFPSLSHCSLPFFIAPGSRNLPRTRGLQDPGPPGPLRLCSTPEALEKLFGRNFA